MEFKINRVTLKSFASSMMALATLVGPITLTALITLLSPITASANDIKEQHSKESNTLWGFRCTSTESKTVTAVALRDGKVLSITVHPEVDGQINFGRTAALREIGQNRYAGEYSSSQYDDNTNGIEKADDQDKIEDKDQQPNQAQLQLPQTLNYEMSFALETNGTNPDATPTNTPKIQQASLKENGIAPTNLNCSPVFQTRTQSAIFL